MRQAGHRDVLVAAGQRDAEQARAEFRVVLEQLVEVALAEEQKHTRVACLGLPVLLHHRGGHGGWLDCSAIAAVVEMAFTSRVAATPSGYFLPFERTLHMRTELPRAAEDDFVHVMAHEHETAAAGTFDVFDGGRIGNVVRGRSRGPHR